MSAELDHERECLAAVERHIVEASEGIAAQLSALEQHRDDGLDASGIEAVLIRLNRMLMEWQVQRDMLTERIKELVRKSA